MAAVVETQIRLSARAAEGLERRRLGAGHVRGKAAEEDDAGRAPRGLVVGDCRAVVPC